MGERSNCWEGKKYTGTGYASWTLPFSASKVKFTVDGHDANDGCERIIANGVTVVDRTGECNYASWRGLCKYAHKNYPGVTVNVIGPAVTVDIRYVDSFYWPGAGGGVGVSGTVEDEAPECGQDATING